jgi:hypothetical protein
VPGLAHQVNGVIRALEYDGDTGFRWDRIDIL